MLHREEEGGYPQKGGRYPLSGQEHSDYKPEKVNVIVQRANKKKYEPKTP